ncbi:hypothetical protein [Streptomyces sp. NPDC000410]|uniref:hypothetical protein n=1 Tax=Streptomyces sp. NPDC000410 TaxID=3154254 RepID=UPI003317E7B1
MKQSAAKTLGVAALGAAFAVAGAGAAAAAGAPAQLGTPLGLATNPETVATVGHVVEGVGPNALPVAPEQVTGLLGGAAAGGGLLGGLPLPVH